MIQRRHVVSAALLVLSIAATPIVTARPASAQSDTADVLFTADVAPFPATQSSLTISGAGADLRGVTFRLEEGVRLVRFPAGFARRVGTLVLDRPGYRVLTYALVPRRLSGGRVALLRRGSLRVVARFDSRDFLTVEHLPSRTTGIDLRFHSRTSPLLRLRHSCPTRHRLSVRVTEAGLPVYRTSTSGSCV